MDLGESFEEVAKREVFKETGEDISEFDSWLDYNVPQSDAVTEKVCAIIGLDCEIESPNNTKV